MKKDTDSESEDLQAVHPAFQNYENESIKKPGFMGSWITLSLCACFFFATQNIAMAANSKLGVDGIWFHNSGALLFVTCFFIYQCCQAKDTLPTLLTRTDGHTNYPVIGWTILNAFVCTWIWFIVMLTMKFSLAAGVNIGLVITIWAINPFTSALMDWFVYSAKLQCFHWLGMSGLLVCAVMVALGQAVVPVSGDSTVTTVASWVPLLMSLAMPVTCTFQVALQKHITTELKIRADDFTCGTYLVMVVVLQIAALVIYVKDPTFFQWNYWAIGFVTSLTSCVGSIFLTAAIGTNQPVGPIIALINCQAIICTIYGAIQYKAMPTAMQFVGFAFGLWGAFVLCMPDEMYGLWFCLTRCRQRTEEDEDRYRRQKN